MHEMALRDVLTHRPFGLITDIDGTLSPIAPTPDAARVSAFAREQLAALAQQVEVVAAVSGRAASDAAAMVRLPNIIYVGNHGFEIWRDGVSQPIPEAQPYVALIDDLLRQAQARVSLPGIIFENKGATASIHYRQAPDPHAAETEIKTVLDDLAAELQVTRGRMVWEIRPPLEVNKGVAIASLVQEHKLRGAMFIGDDRTDADGFIVLRDLREQGICQTLSIGVTGPETPAIVTETADLLVEGVPGVERLLAQLVEYAREQ
jgi:trehalose 6-phosphate phosphatase